MTTLKTLIGADFPPVTLASPKPTCGNGHPWTRETTRWRLRDRSYRADGKGGTEPHWERDCLVCKANAKGREGSGLRTRSWIPGGTK